MRQIQEKLAEIARGKKYGHLPGHHRPMPEEGKTQISWESAWRLSRNFSPHGRRVIEIDELRLPGAFCRHALRRRVCFRPLEEGRSVFAGVPRHTWAFGDEGDSRIGGFSCGSGFQRHGRELGVNLPEQFRVGVSARQRDPHLAYADADHRADLQQFEPNGGAVGLGQLCSLQSQPP